MLADSDGRGRFLPHTLCLRSRLIEIRDKIPALESHGNWHTYVWNGRVLESLNSIIYPILTLRLGITSKIFIHFVLPRRAHSILHSFRGSERRQSLNELVDLNGRNSDSTMKV
ncbi:hypothetical protein FB451DRAFT_1402465 [Mycena latifolia]|nr:hypothetical protein FB451DRAFT_1402465 [Mycena latifolia]